MSLSDHGIISYLLCRFLTQYKGVYERDVNCQVKMSHNSGSVGQGPPSPSKDEVKVWKVTFFIFGDIINYHFLTFTNCLVKYLENNQFIMLPHTCKSFRWTYVLKNYTRRGYTTNKAWLWLAAAKRVKRSTRDKKQLILFFLEHYIPPPQIYWTCVSQDFCWLCLFFCLMCVINVVQGDGIAPLVQTSVLGKGVKHRPPPIKLPSGSGGSSSGELAAAQRKQTSSQHTPCWHTKWNTKRNK